MIGCESLRDRMPAVAHGRSNWTPEESAHLAGCGECSTEWAIVAAGSRLGLDIERRLDTGVIAARVTNRLALARRSDRRMRVGLLLGLAAAAALVLAVWPGPTTTPGGVGSASPLLAVPVAELDGLDSGQLQAVLETLDGPLSSEASTAVPTLGDLDDQQMERVLRSLEG
jgi:hypothetical protein